MAKVFAALLIAMGNLTPAVACQPPPNMPHDPAKAAQFWDEFLLSIKKDIFIGAPTILVARIVTNTSIGKGDSGYMATSARLAPVAIARPGPPATVRED